MNKVKFIVCVVVFMLIGILLVGCDNDSKANAITSLDQRTKIVREGHLDKYPDIKIGDVYGEFFSNPQWKYFESENGKKVVEFSGNCQYEGKEINVRQQFVLNDDKTFSVGALAFNEISQNQLMGGALMAKVYENYAEAHSKK